jgi:hypothetical protein
MPRLDSLQDDSARKKRGRSEAAEERDGDRTHAPPLVSSLGNAAVQRLLRSTEAEEDHPAVDGSVERAIEGKRGDGAALDGETQQQIGGALQADLSDVRVHDDADANELNHAVDADAFTTGNDVFFREGKYQPGTAGGDKLLAHELTHVVQQRGAAAEGGALRVSNPDDAGEQQAEAVANDLTANATASSATVARQEEEEEMLQGSPHLDRQEEEEEMAMPSPHLDRQEEEEEMAMPSPHLDRQEEEEEMLQGSPHLDRQEQEEEEEEEVMPSPHFDRSAEDEAVPDRAG